MKYKDKRDNKAYDNFGMREDEVNNLLTYCKSKRKELESDTVDLSIRRNEKMKKKEYGDAFKKIAIASFSLIATGGIIAGVINYNNSNSQSAKGVVSNKTTEFSTGKLKEETTEKVTEENITEEKKVVDTNFDNNKFHDISFKSENGSVSHTLCAKVFDGYVLKIVEDRDKQVFELGLIKGDDYTVIEKSNEMFDESTFRTYKDKVFYADAVGMKELNLSTLKKEYIFKYGDDSMDCGSQYAFNMDDKYIYISGKTYTQRSGTSTEIADYTGVQYYTYAYDLKTKETKLIGNRLNVCKVDENCFIMAEAPKYPYEDITQPYETPLYIVKVKNGKTKDIAFLGERACCDFLDVETPVFSDKDKNKLYYINYEKKLDSGLTDYNEFTVMSYNIDTKKIEKEAALSTEKLGIGPLKELTIVELKDDYCKFLANEPYDSDSHYKTYKYYYETGKVEVSEEKLLG